MQGNAKFAGASPVYVRYIAKGSEGNRQIEIQDRDIIYRLRLNQFGLQSLEATRGDELCAQISVAKSAGQTKFRLESAYQKRHTDTGYLETNTGPDGLVDSVLMFVKGPEQTVDSVLSFNLLQQNIGLWADNRWADFRVTQDGIHYVEYYTPGQECHQTKEEVAQSFAAKMPVIVNGHKVQPVRMPSQTREELAAAKHDSVNDKTVELLSIVAQLSVRERNKMLDKWMSEARSLIR